jgi:hypothetical protein
MKKWNSLMRSATMMLALALTAAGLQSCSRTDNPSGGNDPVVEPTAQLIIKEINFGGGFKTTANKSYSWCKGMIVYNNGAGYAKMKNLAIGTIPPGNAHANNGNYDANGKLNYENEDWVPMVYAVWYNPNTVTVAPYSDMVIAVNGAIDHTQVAPDAFDLSAADVQAMYDPESQYNNANAYPAPAAAIPATNYWKAAIFGLGNSWAVSIMCPTLALFQFPEGVDPQAYCADPANKWYDGGKETAANYCVKIPKAWVIDAVETYRTTMVADSKKRIPADLDAGYALYNSNKQYSAYRNVDQKATEAIADNAGKLVFGYDQAVEDTQDASGIDAAASLKNGAKIVYMDTNNSTADFHLRKAWSLK